MGDQLYQEIGEALGKKHEIATGQMFGKPCLKINNKAFAAFFKGEMVFKLGREEIKLLQEKYIGSVNWDPSGKKRPMKDWLQIPYEYKDDWLVLAKQALGYLK